MNTTTDNLIWGEQTWKKKIFMKLTKTIIQNVSCSRQYVSLCFLLLLFAFICCFFIIKKAMIIRLNSPLQLPKARSSPLL